MRHHRAGLARLLEGEPAWVDALEAHGRGEGPAPDELTERERAMLGYALRLTADPGAMTRDTLQPLRAAGLSDRAILEANQVVAYFAYANRVADGLGLQLEPFHRRGV